MAQATDNAGSSTDYNAAKANAAKAVEISSTTASLEVPANQGDGAGDSYFWIMIGMLMLFVLAFLVVLKHVRKARLAAYPEILSGFTGRYQRNRSRRVTD